MASITFRQLCSSFLASADRVNLLEAEFACQNNALEADLVGYERTSGALHFPIDKPLPKTLVKKLVKAKLDQTSEVFNGKRRDYYDNGVLKAEGSMRQGELHGAWKWYRRDGSLMREGEFINGSQVGRWRTFDDTGTLVKETLIKR